MGVYLHAKSEVSSIILAGFTQGVILPIAQPQKKKPTQNRVKKIKPTRYRTQH